MPYPYGDMLNRESRVVVMGLPRYGKTTFVRDVLTRDSARMIAHDVVGHDYGAPGRWIGSIEDLERTQWILALKYTRVVVIARSAADPDSLKDETQRIVKLVAQVGDIVCVFDEFQAHQRHSDLIINGLFARGGHFGIVPIICSQRTTDIPLGSRSLPSDAYCFGQHHPTELKALYDAYGDLYAAACANAKKRQEPIHWTDEEREKWWSVQARTPRTLRGLKSAAICMQPLR